LGRTLLALAGLERAAFPGDDLLRRAAERPRFALSSGGLSASVTLARHHLILHLVEHRIDALGEAGLRQRHALELYDLEAGPPCPGALASRERERAIELRWLLVRWLAEAGTGRGWNAGPAGDSEHAERLAQMGYANSRAIEPDAAWIDPECECERCRAFAPRGERR